MDESLLHFSSPVQNTLLPLLGFIILIDIFNLLKQNNINNQPSNPRFHLDEHVPRLPGQDGQVPAEHVQQGGGLGIHSKGVPVTYHNLTKSALASNSSVIVGADI